MLILIVFLSFNMSGQNKPEPASIQEEYAPDTNASITPDDTTENTSTPNQEKAEEQKLKLLDENNSEMEDEELSYPQDNISRKLFQKKLPPLTNHEKIIWAFRMADSNLFL